MPEFKVGDRVTIQPDRTRPPIGCEVISVRVENKTQWLHLAPTDITRLAEMKPKLYAGGSVKIDPILMALG